MEFEFKLQFAGWKGASFISLLACDSAAYSVSELIRITPISSWVQFHEAESFPSDTISSRSSSSSSRSSKGLQIGRGSGGHSEGERRESPQHRTLQLSLLLGCLLRPLRPPLPRPPRPPLPHPAFLLRRTPQVSSLSLEILVLHDVGGLL